MDTIKKKLNEAMESDIDRRFIASGTNVGDKIVTTTRDNSQVKVTQGGQKIDASVSAIADPLMQAYDDADNQETLEQNIDALIQGAMDAKQKQGSGAGLTKPVPIGETVSERRMNRQNELHALFEGHDPKNPSGRVKVTLFHDDLLLIECSRQATFDALAKETVAEAAQPSTLSFFVARSNAAVIAEAIRKLDVKVKNTIRKVADRKSRSIRI